jgi:hypothetical protein
MTQKLCYLARRQLEEYGKVHVEELVGGRQVV